MLLQVIVVALVLSFIVKQDSEVVDYEDAFGKMKTVDYLNLKGKYQCNVWKLLLQKSPKHFLLRRNFIL